MESHCVVVVSLSVVYGRRVRETPLRAEPSRTEAEPPFDLLVVLLPNEIASAKLRRTDRESLTAPDAGVADLELSPLETTAVTRRLS